VASEHLPVLTDRVVGLLAPAGPGLLVDATVGLGGHAEALLRAEPEFQLVGLDRDPQALTRAGERLQPFGDRVQLVEETFDRLPLVLRRLGLGAPVAVLADIGCSSLQLDSAERGFSFASDGPLDMRMGGTGPTAADLLERAEWEELVRILRDYGEERRARAVARAIVRRREQDPLRTTAQLSRLVQDVIGGRERRIHPATRTLARTARALSRTCDSQPQIRWPNRGDFVSLARRPDCQTHPPAIGGALYLPPGFSSLPL